MAPAAAAVDIPYCAPCGHARWRLALEAPVGALCPCVNGRGALARAPELKAQVSTYWVRDPRRAGGRSRRPPSTRRPDATRPLALASVLRRCGGAGACR